MTTMIGDSGSRAYGRRKRPERSGGGRTSGEIRMRRLASAGQPRAAVLTLLLDGPGPDQVWLAAAFLLGAIARDTLGDSDAPERALHHALYLAAPDQVLFPFSSHLRPGVLDRHDQHPSADGTLTCLTADMLAGARRPASPPRVSARHVEALTHGEARVLHYLPSHLSAREIAGELCLSVNTVKTHQRHLYQKLGARSRAQAVEQARALGLLASPSCRR